MFDSYSVSLLPKQMLTCESVPLGPNLLLLHWHNLDVENFEIGPSRVRTLPLAAGRNLGGHYKWHLFSFSLPAHC